jgi:hypothetical protein
LLFPLFKSRVFKFKCENLTLTGVTGLTGLTHVITGVPCLRILYTRTLVNRPYITWITCTLFPSLLAAKDPFHFSTFTCNLGLTKTQNCWDLKSGTIEALILFWKWCLCCHNKSQVELSCNHVTPRWPKTNSQCDMITRYVDDLHLALWRCQPWTCKITKTVKDSQHG